MTWIWTITILLCLAVFVIAQLWWTRQHRKNLDEHNKRMDEIYRRYR